MILYDALIKDIYSFLPNEGKNFLSPNVEKKYIGKKNQLVLKNESMYELGSRNKNSTTLFLLTEDDNLVTQDEVIVYGSDLNEISNDTDYARITILKTKDIFSSTDQKAYNKIENLELRKYDVSPSGYMLRASTYSDREQIRISKDAIKKGLSFKDVGAQFIAEYKKSSNVDACKVIFITGETIFYTQLESIANKAKVITKALNTVFKDIDFDCAHCEWKIVCDETPGMREEHKKYLN